MIAQLAFQKDSPKMMHPPLQVIIGFLLVASVLTAPTSAQTSTRQVLENSTNGSWWIVQFLSTNPAASDSCEFHQRERLCQNSAYASVRLVSSCDFRGSSF